MNVEHFKDLPAGVRQELLEYISESFTEDASKHTAYGLKQHFTSTHPNKEYHVTSRCFMEAMVASGYEAFQVPDVSQPDWFFHVKPLY